MHHHQLAKALRDRLHQRGRIPSEVIEELPDDSIISSYVVCNCCGQPQVPTAILPSLIAEATDATHWFDLMDAYALKSGFKHGK